MAPDLALLLAVCGLLAFTVSLGALVLHAPRCPRCGRPGIAEAREIADTRPLLVEVVYRCGACDGVVGRRTLHQPCE